MPARCLMPLGGPGRPSTDRHKEVAYHSFLTTAATLQPSDSMRLTSSLERGFRLRRLPDAYETWGAERHREHERSRLAVGIELLGQEPRLSRLPHDRDKGTHGSHAARAEADESELVPWSGGIDGQPAARFEPPDEQLVGHPRNARSPESPESCRTKGGRPGDGPARAAGVGHDHFELAVTARCAVDDRTPI
jgi:hypothetical protein